MIPNSSFLNAFSLHHETMLYMQVCVLLYHVLCHKHFFVLMLTVTKVRVVTYSIRPLLFGSSDFRNTVDPWTVSGVRRSAQNLSIIYSQPSTSVVPNLQIKPTVVHIYWRNPHKSGPMQFQPMLFKGQVYSPYVISQV